MDWFRNVPNVIRSSSGQSDHGTGNNRNNSVVADNHSYTSDNADDHPSTSIGYSSTFSSKFNRKTSKEEKYHHHQQQQQQQASKCSAVRDDLICALCGEMYTDPRILPCLHSFCKRCLEHTVNPRSTTLLCHLCRKEITLKVCCITAGKTTVYSIPDISVYGVSFTI